MALRHLRAIWSHIPACMERAALFHDLGKAASGFQQMLQGTGPRWEFRHEVLSAEIFRRCHNLEDSSIFCAYLALLTHHHNLGSATSVNPRFQECCSRTQYSRWFGKWRELMFDELKTEFAPLLDGWEFDANAQSPANDVPLFISKIAPVFADHTLATMRGALVAADHLASSRVGQTALGNNITKVALERYAQSTISCWKGWNFIQQEAGDKHGSAMLVAPTGAGKTEAALFWALANRQRYERIFYMLPYQVSINAMADRIAKAFPDEHGNVHIHDNDNVSILHSNMDLAYLTVALNDELPQEKARAVALANSDAARKIYAPVKITTVYQLLDIFFGRKFFEVGMLELTDSLVIFDEIHAYDGHTLGLILVLLKYLRQLNARIFIMTATLPSKLKEKLQQAAEIAESQEIRLPDGDPLLAEVRRIIVPDNTVVEDMIESVRHTVRAGKKTVVVCNTVKKAIRMWELLREFRPLLVHSRFALGDRSSRETKENIRKYPLVIATQVIEVSLDVSFEVLFTELAPVDSLLQRFGRVNRHGEADPNHVGVCYIASGEDAGSRMIYDPELLDRTRTHLPLDPLTFDVACNWIEGVYPKGLSAKEETRMKQASDAFNTIVAQLKPMIDAPADVETEKSLLDTVQVIPKEYEEQWQSLRENRQYLEAKKLVVNVSRYAWRRAGQTPENYYENTRIQPANFEYDVDTGLRLDKRL
jgi:CRISPR-associated endonuclease/helicase Cas3